MLWRVMRILGGYIKIWISGGRGCDTFRSLININKNIIRKCEVSFTAFWAWRWEEVEFTCVKLAWWWVYSGIFLVRSGSKRTDDSGLHQLLSSLRGLFLTFYRVSLSFKAERRLLKLKFRFLEITKNGTSYEMPLTKTFLASLCWGCLRC